MSPAGADIKEMRDKECTYIIDSVENPLLDWCTSRRDVQVGLPTQLDTIDADEKACDCCSQRIRGKSVPTRNLMGAHGVEAWRRVRTGNDVRPHCTFPVF